MPLHAITTRRRLQAAYEKILTQKNSSKSITLRESLPQLRRNMKIKPWKLPTKPIKGVNCKCKH